MDHFGELLRSIVKDPKQLIGKLSLLSASEQRDLKALMPQRWITHGIRRIVDLFEEQAEKSPDSIAIIFEEVEWSYRELNERTNSVAHHLRSLGVVEGLWYRCISSGGH